MLTIAFREDGNLVHFGVSVCRPEELIRSGLFSGGYLVDVIPGDRYDRKVGNRIAEGRMEKAITSGITTPLSGTVNRPGAPWDSAAEVLAFMVDTHVEGSVRRLAEEALDRIFAEMYNNPFTRELADSEARKMLNALAETNPMVAMLLNIGTFDIDNGVGTLLGPVPGASMRVIDISGATRALQTGDQRDINAVLADMDKLLDGDVS